MFREAFLHHTMMTADASARRGELDGAIDVAERALVVLARAGGDSEAQVQPQPLYRRLASWHRRRGNANVAATFEARLSTSAASRANESELTIPIDDRALSLSLSCTALPPAPSAMTVAFRPIVAARAPAESANAKPARTLPVLCRPSPKRARTVDAKRTHHAPLDVVSDFLLPVFEATLTMTMCVGVGASASGADAHSNSSLSSSASSSE
jgi:hypothetical protein